LRKKIRKALPAIEEQLIMSPDDKKYVKIVLIIVVIIIFVLVLGLIAYCGVAECFWRPLPPRCAFNGSIKCSEFQIIVNNDAGQGILHYKAINQGKTASNFSFNATAEGCIIPWGNTFDIITCSSLCEVWPDGGVNIEPKQLMEVTCIFNGTFSAGDHARIDVKSSTGSEGIIYGRVK
jgi:archaellin